MVQLRLAPASAGGSEIRTLGPPQWWGARLVRDQSIVPSELWLLIRLVQPQFPAEQFHAPLRLNNATRLSGKEWLWSAKRA